MSAQPGRSLAVAIHGSFTNFVPGITQVSFGAGVSVGGGVIADSGPVTVTSATTAVAQVSIIPQAQFGPQTVTVQTRTE